MNEQPSIDVREMELEDLAPTYHLGEKLYTADKWPTLYRTWDEGELLSYYAKDGSVCLVAELEDRLVGFAVGSLVEKRRGAWSYGYLAWLGVDPSAVRLGVGTRLLRRMANKFIQLGARMMIVDTDADNAPALSLFRKYGFGDEMDQIFLSKNLTTEPDYRRLRKKRDE